MSKKGEYKYPKLHNKEWMENALRSGWSYQKIADSIDCSYAAVSLAIRRLKLTGISQAIHRSRQYKRSASLFGDAQTLQAMVDEGWTLRQLADHFQVSKGTLRNRLSDLEVEFPERAQYGQSS